MIMNEYNLFIIVALPLDWTIAVICQTSSFFAFICCSSYFVLHALLSPSSQFIFLPLIGFIILFLFLSPQKLTCSLLTNVEYHFHSLYTPTVFLTSSYLLFCLNDSSFFFNLIYLKHIIWLVLLDYLFQAKQ